VDEGDINLIASDAMQMQEFALARGVTTREQVEDAVSAYVAENGITPPQDVAFVAAVLFQNMKNSGQIQE
jgi:TnpA family transposase